MAFCVCVYVGMRVCEYRVENRVKRVVRVDDIIIIQSNIFIYFFPYSLSLSLSEGPVLMCLLCAYSSLLTTHKGRAIKQNHNYGQRERDSQREREIFLI